MRSSGRSMFALIVTHSVRRSRSPPMWTLLPVTTHSRSLCRLSTVDAPSSRSDHAADVSSPSSTDDFSTPVTLSNCTTGPVVASSVEVTYFRNSSSPAGTPT